MTINKGDKLPVNFQALEAVLAPLVKQIGELRQRVAELEDRGLKYCGTHQRAQDYRRGDSVTHKGSLWTAIKATEKEPGTSPDWQLSARGETK
ncbi:MAG: hypothetical protein WA161_21350 [Pseudomonas sp.]|uniref:hypothetical protein n=1 Tax=Pseudomonas sp. TaxID=306 RepID=UPI003BB68FAA